MGWKIVERRIGKAGNLKQRNNRQKKWTQKYGDNWIIGYNIDGVFLDQEAAIEKIYHESYRQHFEMYPNDLEELIATAKVLRNPHAEATGGVDLQVPAILAYLKANNLELLGKEIVDIGTMGNRSHKISVRLSPLTIKVIGNPKMTLEQFWQDKKCLAVWEE